MHSIEGARAIGLYAALPSQNGNNTTNNPRIRHMAAISALKRVKCAIILMLMTIAGSDKMAHRGLDGAKGGLATTAHHFFFFRSHHTTTTGDMVERRQKMDAKYVSALLHADKALVF